MSCIHLSHDMDFRLWTYTSLGRLIMYKTHHQFWKNTRLYCLANFTSSLSLFRYWVLKYPISYFCIFLFLIHVFEMPILCLLTDSDWVKMWHFRSGFLERILRFDLKIQELVQLVMCTQFCTWTFSTSVLTYCVLKHWQQTPVKCLWKCKNPHSTKLIWKRRLQHGVYLLSVSRCSA